MSTEPTTPPKKSAADVLTSMKNEVEGIVAHLGRLAASAAELTESSFDGVPPQTVVTTVNSFTIATLRASHLLKTIRKVVSGSCMEVINRARHTAAAGAMPEGLLKQTNCGDPNCPMHGHLNEKQKPGDLPS